MISIMRLDMVGMGYQLLIILGLSWACYCLVKKIEAHLKKYPIKQCSSIEKIHGFFLLQRGILDF